MVGSSDMVSQTHLTQLRCVTHVLWVQSRYFSLVLYFSFLFSFERIVPQALGYNIYMANDQPSSTYVLAVYKTPPSHLPPDSRVVKLTTDPGSIAK